MNYSFLQYEIVSLFEELELRLPDNLQMIAKNIFDKMNEVLKTFNLKCENFQYLLNLEEQEKREISDNIDERVNEHNRYYRLLNSKREFQFLQHLWTNVVEHPYNIWEN